MVRSGRNFRKIWVQDRNFRDSPSAQGLETSTTCTSGNSQLPKIRRSSRIKKLMLHNGFEIYIVHHSDGEDALGSGVAEESVDLMAQSENRWVCWYT